jgi:predicted O-linked N-acetylglucosamine transferase (SPINDLY family)
MSADFVGHAVSCFIACLLQGFHDRNIKVYLLSNANLSAVDISKLKCTKYISIHNQKPDWVVEVLRQLQCSTVVDLSGHTNGNRMDVMYMLNHCVASHKSRSFVPALYTYCGYPNDLGFEKVRRITDKKSEPFLDGRKHVDLGRLFLCYRPPDPYTRLECKDWTLYKPDGLITLGTFCKLSKISPLCVSMWKQILKRNTRARLIIKSKFFDDDQVKQDWKNKFGNMKHRVLFMAGTDSSEEHMKLYKVLDLHLDTWPYSGTTITTESLYMDVPVLTLCKKDDAHVSRVSSSILTSMGLDEKLVATTPEAYVEAVEHLIPILDTLNVRRCMEQSPLLDAESLLDSMENLFERDLEGSL